MAAGPHDAILTPDIVREIMIISSNSARAAGCRVCRGWSDIATDPLWEDLDNILPLLELLAPVEFADNDQLMSKLDPITSSVL
ncbi:hypothetical protein FRB95_000793 [Tulasnella sp. JGI-2019a]|nr:hypothetical protein FRB95_000793 [Tulasnella sp. JGI-2019a]